MHGMEESCTDIPSNLCWPSRTVRVAENSVKPVPFREKYRVDSGRNVIDKCWLVVVNSPLKKE